MAQSLPKETIEKMQMLFEAGFGIRAVSRKLDISRTTAACYFPRIGDEPLCPCGRPVRHKGWCFWRYRNSSARQEFMKQWHVQSKEQLWSIPNNADDFKKWADKECPEWPISLMKQAFHVWEAWGSNSSRSEYQKFFENYVGWRANSLKIAK